ncbi:trigger factor [Sphingosinicella sp. BN140058]|uniref:trigger factor n=1 Tax=Sphingosinicella sp. BN140058 TaxID=1892855 RepID=UPI0010131003|nr:trigger factor [Sphingosinicella sp. BN140058]QAY79260.1 trigger factor [Sphingosinicella sp. BN140058]
MQTVETLNEGLKRAYRITIPSSEIDARVDGELKKVAPQIRMPGFRPGKVPANLVRKMHGPALQQEALNTAVQEGVQQLLTEQKLRPAMQPAVELEEGGPGQDAVVRVELETLPDVPEPQIEGLTLERLTVEPTDAEVDEALERMAQGQKSYDPAPEGHEAATGDLVVIDYVGKVAGKAFEGGTGDAMRVELGSGRLIPGFEDQLVGVKAGDERTLNVTFPDDYPAENLKGKDATFDVKVTEVQLPREGGVDDEFAKAMGLESLEQLRGLLKGQIEQELNGLTRTHMKRKLLDRLAESHSFEVPPSMVEAEFSQIWQQLEHEASHEEDPAAALAEIEAEREDYRAIAERRVRLGLLLSEIGTRNNVQVNQNEMNQLIMQAAQQYRPEDRQRFVEYVRNEPMAAAQLRAPLFEDKVVDFLFSKAEVTDRAVSREELQAEIESTETGTGGHVHGPDCNHDHDHDHDHAEGKPKKKAAKKAKSAEAAPSEEAPAAEAPAAEAPAAEDKPAKKPRAKKAAPAEDAAPAAEVSADEGAAEAKPAKKSRAKKA